jgi:hypothetical protein
MKTYTLHPFDFRALVTVCRRLSVDGCDPSGKGARKSSVQPCIANS